MSGLRRQDLGSEYLPGPLGCADLSSLDTGGDALLWAPILAAESVVVAGRCETMTKKELLRRIEAGSTWKEQ